MATEKNDRKREDGDKQPSSIEGVNQKASDGGDKQRDGLQTQGDLVGDVHGPLQGHVVGVAILAHLEDTDDVGVDNGGCDLGLTVEPLHVGGVPSQVRVSRTLYTVAWPPEAISSRTW